MGQANNMLAAAAQPAAAAAAYLRPEDSGQERREAGSRQCWASTSGSYCAKRCSDACAVYVEAIKRSAFLPLCGTTLLPCHQSTCSTEVL